MPAARNSTTEFAAAKLGAGTIWFMSRSNPTKPKRPNRTLMAIALIMAVIPIAFCFFFFGGFYGLIAGAVLFGCSAFLGWSLRRRGHLRGETDRQTDTADGQSGDDPRQMARFIP